MKTNMDNILKESHQIHEDLNKQVKKIEQEQEEKDKRHHNEEREKVEFIKILQTEKQEREKTIITQRSHIEEAQQKTMRTQQL